MAPEPSPETLGQAAMGLEKSLPDAELSLPARYSTRGESFLQGRITRTGADGVFVETASPPDVGARLYVETALPDSGEAVGFRAKVFSVRDQPTKLGGVGALLRPLGLTDALIAKFQGFLKENPGRLQRDAEDRIQWSLVAETGPVESNADGLYRLEDGAWVFATPGSKELPRGGQSLDYYRDLLRRAFLPILATTVGPVPLAFRGRRLSPQEGLAAPEVWTGLGEEGEIEPVGRALVAALAGQMRVADELCAAGWRPEGCNYETLWDVDDSREMLNHAIELLAQAHAGLPDDAESRSLKATLDGIRLRLKALERVVAQTVQESRANLGLQAAEAGSTGLTDEVKAWLNPERAIRAAQARAEEEAEEDDEVDLEAVVGSGRDLLRKGVPAMIVILAAAVNLWRVYYDWRGEQPDPRAAVGARDFVGEFQLEDIRLELPADKFEAVADDWWAFDELTQKESGRKMCERLTERGFTIGVFSDRDGREVLRCSGTATEFIDVPAPESTAVAAGPEDGPGADGTGADALEAADTVPAWSAGLEWKRGAPEPEPEPEAAAGTGAGATPSRYPSPATAYPAAGTGAPAVGSGYTGAPARPAAVPRARPVTPAVPPRGGQVPTVVEDLDPMAPTGGLGDAPTPGGSPRKASPPRRRIGPSLPVGAGRRSAQEGATTVAPPPPYRPQGPASP